MDKELDFEKKLVTMIEQLLGCCELNLDEMEPHTTLMIRKALRLLERVEKIQVCPYCHSETTELEGITHCSEDCGCIEGEDSCYMTREELEGEE